MNQLETVITINNQKEAIPALATAQVLSLFGLNSQVLTYNDLEKSNLPNESVIILMENQIRTTLTKLRRQKWAGAVLIISSIPDQQLFQKYSYILKYSRKTNNATWEKPYNLSDLLTKLNQLKPLNRGNLNLLTENIDKANLKSQEAIEQLSQEINKLSQFKPNNPALEQQLAEIEHHFEQLFSPLSKHTKIILDNYGEANISSHFRKIIKEIQAEDHISSQKIETLQQIVSILAKQMQDLGEDLEIFSN